MATKEKKKAMEELEAMLNRPMKVPDRATVAKIIAERERTAKAIAEMKRIHGELKRPDEEGLRIIVD
jgi:chorismate mutase